MDTIQRINALFEAKGQSNRSILLELGFSPTALAEWNRGKAKPTVDAIIKIANYFGVSTDYLLGLTDLPLAPASWFIFKDKIFAKGSKTLEEVAMGICQPMSLFTDWELGKEPDARTLWSICNFYQLTANPFMKTNPSGTMDNEVFDGNIDYILSKNYSADYLEKVFKEFNEKQRLYVISWIVGYAKSQGIKVTF